jgi:uncharacterized membrane protein
MLVVFPLGLLATAVVFDLVAAAADNLTAGVVAYWMMASGIVGALLAAPFGLVDWLHVPTGTRARRIGALHGGGNLVVTLLFVASWLLRDGDGSVPGAALALSVAGALLALVTAWLGGELVSRLGVGVYEDAGLDAPSSLRASDEPGGRAAVNDATMP